MDWLTQLLAQLGMGGGASWDALMNGGLDSSRGGWMEDDPNWGRMPIDPRGGHNPVDPLKPWGGGRPFIGGGGGGIFGNGAIGPPPGQRYNPQGGLGFSGGGWDEDGPPRGGGLIDPRGGHHPVDPLDPWRPPHRPAGTVWGGGPTASVHSPWLGPARAAYKAPTPAPRPRRRLDSTGRGWMEDGPPKLDQSRRGAWAY